jgi:transposase InsO family protein
VRYAFIAAHREQFAVTELCRVVGVAPSGYYAWRKRPASQRARDNERLVERIREVHTTSRQTYGSPRITVELREAGEGCNHKRVERLMRLHGIQAKTPRRFCRTTDSRHDQPVVGNLLNQQFEAAAPNRVWTADITYIDTAEGWLYLAVVMDLFSRRIVGWAMADHMLTSLVEDALDMALEQRCPTDGLLHHSDRGSQYASQAYQDRLTSAGIQPSMSRRANCYDNATQESFFGTLKSECVTQRYPSRAAARSSIFEYIEVWYNRQRRHSTLGYLSPEQFENKHSMSSLSIH